MGKEADPLLKYKTNRLRSFLITLGLTYLFVVTGMFLIQRSLIYMPAPVAARGDGAPAMLPSDYHVPQMASVLVPTSDGLDLLGWYYRPTATATPSGGCTPMLLYFHGNGGHIGHVGGRLRPYMDAGMGVLLVSWRGYSGNAGSPSEEGLTLDGRAALSFLRDEGVRPSCIVLYGASLGGGVAVKMAAEMARAKTPVGALVLEAPFTTLDDAATSRYPWLPVRLLLLDHYDSLSLIDAIDTPLFILHGSRDGIIPSAMGRRLLDAASQPKAGRFYPEGRHNNLYRFDAPLDVLTFLKEKTDLYPPPR